MSKTTISAPETPSNSSDCSEVPCHLKARDCIGGWINVESMQTATALVGDCPLEILGMVAALAELDVTTREAANDQLADGFFLTAESTTERAYRYRESMSELSRIWGGPPDADDGE